MDSEREERMQRASWPAAKQTMLTQMQQLEDKINQMDRDTEKIEQNAKKHLTRLEELKKQNKKKMKEVIAAGHEFRALLEELGPGIINNGKPSLLDVEPQLSYDDAPLDHLLLQMKDRSVVEDLLKHSPSDLDELAAALGLENPKNSIPGPSHVEYDSSKKKTEEKKKGESDYSADSEAGWEEDEGEWEEWDDWEGWEADCESAEFSEEEEAENEGAF